MGRFEYNFSPKISDKMKQLTFCFLLSFISSGLCAQFSFSPIVALNYSKARASQKEFDSSPVFRYAMGVQPVYHFNEEIAAGLGLQLAMKGYKDKPGGLEIFEETRFQYIEANPFFEYRPFKFLGIIIGGSIGYNTQIEFKFDGKWHDAALQFGDRKWDIAMAGGLRYYYGNAFLNVNYAQSMVPFNELFFTDENGVSLGKLKQYHQTISFGLGYNFHLKKK